MFTNHYDALLDEIACQHGTHWTPDSKLTLVCQFLQQINANLQAFETFLEDQALEENGETLVHDEEGEEEETGELVEEEADILYRERQLAADDYYHEAGLPPMEERDVPWIIEGNFWSKEVHWMNLVYPNGPSTLGRFEIEFAPDTAKIIKRWTT